MERRDTHRPMSEVGLFLVLLGLGLGLIALVIWRLGHWERKSLGLPSGRIISVDVEGWRTCEQPLYSARYRLAGRPDYLVQMGHSLVPVEVKPGRAADRPYPGDVLQLGAYLLLLEEKTGCRPPCGLLRYREHTFEIPYTVGLRQSVIACLGEMQRLRTARQVIPQHREPQRCWHCGHREHCTERLV